MLFPDSYTKQWLVVHGPLLVWPPKQTLVGLLCLRKKEYRNTNHSKTIFLLARKWDRKNEEMGNDIWFCLTLATSFWAQTRSFICFSTALVEAFGYFVGWSHNTGSRKYCEWYGELSLDGTRYLVGGWFPNTTSSVAITVGLPLLRTPASRGTERSFDEWS